MTKWIIWILKKGKKGSAWKFEEMVYAILLPSVNVLIRSHKQAPEKSLRWLLAGLNFHTVTQWRQMVWQSRSLLKLKESLSACAFGGVVYHPVTQHWQILPSKMLYTPCNSYFNKAETDMQSARRNMVMWIFRWHKRHIKSIIRHQETYKRMFTALFKTRFINSEMDI